MLINGRGESAIMSDERLLVTRPLDAEKDIPTNVGANLSITEDKGHWQEPRQEKPAYTVFERHIILSDYHHRTFKARDWITGKVVEREAHDPRALAAAEKFMLAWKPTHIHYLGDWVDFFAISRFCKEPPDSDEANNSLGAVADIMRKHRSWFPKAQMDFELGNHDARWQTYIMANAPALAGLPSLTYEAILNAKELGLTVYPYTARVEILPGVLEITHGDKVRGKSGLTAHAMLEKGISGISGHTHRLGMVYKTNRAGTVMWAENGCLCSLSPDYAADPDWQQGFSVIYVDRANNRFHADQIPIINGRIVYAGQVYEAA